MRRTTALTALALCTLIAGTAQAAGSTAGPKATAAKKISIAKRPAAVNKLYLTKDAALSLWAKLKPLFARVEGTITIDPAVQPYLLGSCSDIVVRSYDGQLDSAHAVATVKAFGDIASGHCDYVLYMKANDDTRMFAWYDGPASPDHPGDYLEINGSGPQPFAATTGGKTDFDFRLTYDWIK